MSKPVVIILALGGVTVVLLLVWAPVRAKLALMDLEQDCAAIRARLSVIRTQGGSVDEQARLEAQLNDCQEALRKAGVPVDEAGELLKGIQDVRRQMRQEFTHLRSTDYSDVLKRGSTRGTIMRLGEQMAQQYDALLATVDAGSPQEELATLKAIRAELQTDVADSLARKECYRLESPGCGRYAGSVEDDATSKVNAELDRVYYPLREIRGRIDERLRELGFEPAETIATGGTSEVRA